MSLTRGLARAVEASGGRVFEQSPADTLELAGTTKTVRTRAGSVRRENVVLAGGGYIGALHWPVSMATVPIATFVLITEPLGDLLHQTIGVPYAISDITTATSYYRPLADGLWVATGFGGLGLVLTTLAGRLIGAGMTEGDDRWRQFAEFGLPFAGGKLGRVPAQFVYWRHQAENWLGRHKRA